MEEEKSTVSPMTPPGTSPDAPTTAPLVRQASSVTHRVEERETLNSIAAKYNVTPSWLAAQNKLNSSRMVFPGQILHIPPFVEKPPEKKEEAPAVRRRRPTPVEVVEEEEIIEQQFIKINVRHVTDGSGVVLGSLLLTPKMLMFNPNSTDLLVRENEPDMYQIIAPIELIVNVAIFNDFSRFSSTLGIASKEENSNDLYLPPEEEEATAEEDGPAIPPLYLRFVMGKPIAKKLPRTTPVVSYGDQTLSPEYWFLLKRKSAQHVHNFISGLPDERYGLLDHMAIGRRGYEILRPGAVVFQEEAGKGCNRESVTEMFQNRLNTMSLDIDGLPDMEGESEILSSEGERLALAQELPPKVDGLSWKLFFSTSAHGFSLHSLYRKVKDHEGPVLLLFEDLSGQAFGAYLSATLRISEHFRGTGETFVFRLRPQLKVFHWTGENDFFFKCEPHEFIVGSSDGKFALWVDEELNQGRSEDCATFDNEPLTEKKDFAIKTVECWAFDL